MAGSTSLSLDVKGTAEVSAMLNGLGLDIQDLKGAMTDVGDRAIKVFSGQVFASQGGFIDQQWPRLSPRYAVEKAKHWAGRPPLVRTGVMQRSFVKAVGPMEVTVSNSASYFKYHQSSAARRKLPRRAMIGIYQGMQSDVTNTIAAALSRKIAARVL